MNQMEVIKINTEYITLQQFLKITDFISSGGTAKYYLMDHAVYVNGELEQRRGRKLYSGYKIQINKREFEIQ